MKDTPTAPLFPTKTNLVSADRYLLKERLWQVIKWLVDKRNHLPKVLAIPVFTLSEKTWEILFSCSGLTRTTIRMFHKVWIATWKMKRCISALHLDSAVTSSLCRGHSLVWSWCLWCSSGVPSLCLPIPSLPKDPPESRSHKNHAGCDPPCRLESSLGPYTETRSSCCWEDWRFLWVCGEVFYSDDTWSIMTSNNSNVYDVSIVTHVPGAKKHCDHVRLRLFRVLVLHLLK